MVVALASSLQLRARTLEAPDLTVGDTCGLEIDTDGLSAWSPPVTGTRGDPVRLGLHAMTGGRCCSVGRTAQDHHRLAGPLGQLTGHTPAAVPDRTVATRSPSFAPANAGARAVDPSGTMCCSAAR